MKDEEWNDIIEINFLFVFCLLKVVMCVMMKKCYGCIIIIGFVVGIMGNGGQVNYAAVKVGLIGFSKLLVCEVVLCGIIVNVVVLGFIEMDMICVLSDDQCVGILVQVFVGCFGGVQEIVNVVVFLVFDEAVYIMGEILYVNGGMYMV